ncbi:hypothetical protein ATZ33_15310 [Enterococcus silesiacus]|uniref:ATPase domain-containing protein n=1 Tax=Enterococcus silesiacus TaxID=332949 RepID=A0A0S3KEH1_9ENTE|nr:ATP-binding protein [Enterococcus silesiacus]ALS02694.1 hypothetical protein ATZ33_15310 [Enterococcus silesiacus]OJG89754.1 hypothetical protein RV15_GL001595 [Enterococcus silesiacus]
MKRKVSSIFHSISKPVKVLLFLILVVTLIYLIYIFKESGIKGILNTPKTLYTMIITAILTLLGCYEAVVLLINRNYIEINPKSPINLVFVDRTNELTRIINWLNEKRNINIYGQSGIGKTYLAKQLVSILNNSDKLEDNYKNLTPNNDILAFYISASFERDLEELVIEEVNKSAKEDIHTVSDVLSLFMKIGTQNIIFVIDSLRSDAEQRRKIELLLKELEMNKTRFVIISEEPLHPTQVTATNFFIGDRYFTAIEIKEIMKKLSCAETDIDADAILNVSSGLPVIIDLVIQNIQSERDLADKNCYLFSLLESLLYEEESQYYLFRELIVRCIFNYSSDIHDLTFNKSDLNRLREKHLINDSFNNNKVTIHKVIEHGFHYVFDCRDKETYRKIHKKEFEKYKNTDSNRALSHLLCSDVETINKESEFVINTYERLLKFDSYDRLLNNFQLFDSLSNKSAINQQLATYFTYGNLFSLMGIGQYSAADDFFNELTVDYGTLHVNQAITDMDYRFLLKRADLSHLVNQFDTALEDLELLVNNIKNSTLSEEIKEEYHLEYKLLIAHIEGHKGENIQAVTRNYFKLLNTVEKNYAKNPLQFATIYVKSIYGLICSHMVLHSDSKQFSYTKYFNLINSVLNQNTNELEHLYHRVNRHYSMYLRQKKEFPQSETVLKESIEYFKEHSHRIIYDFYFSLADLFREQEKFDDAIDYYARAENYAEDISDINLYIYCRLGTILSLAQNEENKNQTIEYVEELKKLLKKSVDTKMYIHQLHIKLVLYALVNQQEAQLNVLEQLAFRGLNFEKKLIEKEWSIKNLNSLHLIVR